MQFAQQFRRDGENEIMNIVPITTTQAKNVAIMYSDKDTNLKNDLFSHLVPLRRDGKISIIEASQTMPRLDIILILISPSFIGDDRLLNAANYAVAQWQPYQRIIPILLRPAEIPASLAKLVVFPRNEVPISKQDKDEAFAKIATEIRAMIKGMQ